MCIQDVMQTKNCKQKKFFLKMLFAYKIRFAVENLKKCFMAISISSYHQKNASHSIFRHRNCMIIILFQKKRNIVFFITRLFYCVKIAAETSWNLFSVIFFNWMKFVWLAFFHTFDVWNCKISIFGSWRSTRIVCVCLRQFLWHKKHHEHLIVFFLFKQKFLYFLLCDKDKHLMTIVHILKEINS